MTDLTIKRLNASQSDFDSALAKLLAWDDSVDHQVNESVRHILHEVKTRGDQAVLEFTEKFDRLSVGSVAELEMDNARLQQSLKAIPEDQRVALEQAAERVRDYHERQNQKSWQYEDADGTVLGQKVTPLDRAGLYVPGGKAAYPSSVLMNAIPAKVAGVGEVIMVVPTPDGVVNDMVLAAAAIAGVDRVFTIGGAQAVGALAYGTDTIPSVDKIVGPGNIFVATAKREVFGVVGIDMIAGPSEILVISDGKTDP
ncbi:MAG: histidinol dehydrogenase, partial [Marinobacter sp.]|nr:histidinol dehydrogenase [Marinobacter sp.]